MANERTSNQFPETKESSTIQIPTAVRVGDAFLDHKQELAILLAKIHDLSKGEQLRNRFKYSLRGLLLLFVSFLIPPLVFLGFNSELSLVFGGVLAWCFSFLAVVLIFKGFSVAWRPLSLRKVYLTKYLVPYDSTEANRSTLVFDANSLHDDTNLRYSEITTDQIQEVIEIQSTIADQDRNFDTERQVAQTFSEINNIVVSQVPTDINSQVLKNDSSAVKGIQSVISIAIKGQPDFKSHVLRFKPDDARTQTNAIHSLENKKDSLPALSDIRQEIKRVSDQFVGPLDKEISVIEQYGDFVKKSQSNRWFKDEPVQENMPELDYGEFGLTIGRYNAFQNHGDENPLKLLSIPNKIIRRLQDINKKDVDDLIESEKREILDLEERSSREITTIREKADRAIQRMRSSIEKAQVEYSHARAERKIALETYKEYSGKGASTATERASFQATARGAQRTITARDKKMGELKARIGKYEEDAEQEEIRTQDSISKIQTSVERQATKSRNSVGSQVQSKMAGIEKIINVRDIQLDLAFTFLNHSLTEETESHSRPFLLRRNQLFKPSTDIQNEIDSRVEDLTQILGQINDLKTNIVVDMPTQIHIPFWIAELAKDSAKDSEKHIRVFTPGEIENKNESNGSWLKEKMGATQYLNSLKPISDDLTPVAVELLGAKNNVDMPLNSIQIPLGQEESGILTDQLSGLAKQGLISQKYANRVTKYWTGKSVGQNNKFDSREFTEKVFVHDQEQKDGISHDVSDAVAVSALNTQGRLLPGSDGMEINVAIDYKLNLDGKVVDHPKDVDSLISLLTNIDEFWIISDEGADEHFIQAAVGSEESEHDFSIIEHWNEGSQTATSTDVDVTFALKIVKVFLEGRDLEEVEEDEFCTHCTSQLTPGQRFCPSCGEKTS